MTRKLTKEAGFTIENAYISREFLYRTLPRGLREKYGFYDDYIVDGECIELEDICEPTNKGDDDND